MCAPCFLLWLLHFLPKRTLVHDLPFNFQRRTFQSPILPPSLFSMFFGHCLHLTTHFPAKNILVTYYVVVLFRHFLNDFSYVAGYLSWFRPFSLNNFGSPWFVWRFQILVLRRPELALDLLKLMGIPTLSSQQYPPISPISPSCLQNIGLKLPNGFKKVRTCFI